MTGIIVSIPPTVEVPPGNNASNPSSLPPVTYQYAVLNIPQTWTAKQTFPLGNISIQAADVAGLVDASNASNITSGTLPAARLYATGAPLVVLVTGQSFLTTFTTLAWTPAPNLLVWNFSGVDGNVGTAYAAPSNTTISLPTSYLSRLAKENPTRTIYAIVIGFGGMAISHWLSGASSPDIYQNILNNITGALAAVPGAPTKIERFVWVQGQGDCVPLNANYIANHATMMSRFWGNSWFPKETRCDIFSIASVADGDPVNTDADKMNDLLLAITNADPDKRRYFYLSSLSGAAYWDATNPGHPTAAGSVAMAQLIGRSNLSSVVNDPATKQLVFGNPTYPGNGNPIVTINANLSQAILIGPPTGTVSHTVGANGAASYHVLDNFGGSGNELIGRYAGGTIASPTTTPADSLLIGVASESFDGTGGTFTSVNGAFQIYSNGLQSGTNHGTYALLYLTPNGSTTVTQVARFDPGSIMINGTTSGGMKLAVPAVAGAGTATFPAGTYSLASVSINAQTGAAYAIVDGDRSKLVTATNAAAQAYTIAQAGAAAAFLAGWFVDIQNNSTNVLGVVTITPAASTINYGGTSAATIKVYQGQTIRLISDGANYEAIYLQAAGPWLPYTTTPSSSGGAITTFGAVTARFCMTGPKACAVQADVPITAFGTGSGFLKATLPFTAAAFAYLGVAREVVSSGKSGVAHIPANGTFMQAIDSTATTFIASGAEVVYDCLYEIA